MNYFDKFRQKSKKILVIYATYDLTTPIGRGFIAFLSALAEDERQRIVKRANDGRKAARARGAVFGRKPKLSAPQIAHARKLVGQGEPVPEVARLLSVDRATIYRALNREAM